MCPVNTLRQIIGLETDPARVNAALCQCVRQTGAPVVGALTVTCSDESELECSLIFQRQFVARLLPELKSGVQAPLRTCNLGARHEPGSLSIAEHHFATPAAREAFKVLLVKINGHVAAWDHPAAIRYGPMQRYQADSTACGALHALLVGQPLPACEDLRQTFTADGIDRVSLLLDAGRIDPACRYLLAATVNARLQARRALEEIQQHKPHSPTLYLVVPCVTLNRPGPDGELLVGWYWADYRGTSLEVRYEGLGDDPARYRVHTDGPRGRITEGSEACQ